MSSKTKSWGGGRGGEGTHAHRLPPTQMCTSLYHILWNQNPYKFILLRGTEVKTTANVHHFKSLSVITDLHKNTDPIAPNRQSRKCHKVIAQYNWHNSNKWLLCRGSETVPLFTDWMAKLFLKNGKQEVWWQGGGGDLWILPKEYSWGEDTYSGGRHLFRWWCHLFRRQGHLFRRRGHLFRRWGHLFRRWCHLFKRWDHLFRRWGHLFRRWCHLFKRWGHLFRRWGHLFSRWGHQSNWDQMKDLGALPTEQVTHSLLTHPFPCSLTQTFFLLISWSDVGSLKWSSTELSQPYSWHCVSCCRTLLSARVWQRSDMSHSILPFFQKH